MGAASYALTTYVIYNISPVHFKYVAFVFFATLSNYIFHRIFPVYHRNYKSHPNPIFKWTIKHLKLLTLGFLLSLFLSGILFLYLNNASKIILIALAVLTAAYSLPLFSGKKKRLRDISYLKILLIAFTWSVICGNLVLVNCASAHSLTQHLAVFVEKFLFLLAITIPFDIRDYEQDKIELVKTLPNSIGIKQSIFIALICLLVSLSVVIFMDIGFYYKLAYAFAYMYAAILIFAASAKKNAMYYLFYLDAALILLGAFVYISHLIMS